MGLLKKMVSKSSLKENRGFTLLECLLALFVLSGILLIFSMLVTIGKQVPKKLDSVNNREFEIFLLQLENEAKIFQEVKVSGNIIYFNKGPEDVKDMKIIKINGRIDKRPGTQPLLTDVQDFRTRLVGHTVEIEVVFDDQKVCQGKYILSKEQLAIP